MSTIHLTGRSTSALVAQLLRTVFQLNLEVSKEREEKIALKEEQEAEKNNLLELMFTLNKTSAACNTPTTTTASIESSSELSTNSNTASSSSIQLTIPASKTKVKSPKKVLQDMVINEPEQFEFTNPSHPPEHTYQNVKEFLFVNQKGMPFNGSYICRNCNTVVISSLARNLQRTFSCHLSRCTTFIEKIKSNDSKENNVETEGPKDDGDKQGVNASDGDGNDSNVNHGKTEIKNDACE